MNCKDCAHAGKCETLFDNTEVCEDYRASCPLPRIGSKEWKWAPSNGAHESPLTRYWVVQSVYECRAEVWCENGEVAAVSGVRAFSHAKRIAELLARRDWRKEHGKR